MLKRHRLPLLHRPCPAASRGEGWEARAKFALYPVSWETHLPSSSSALSCWTGMAIGRLNGSGDAVAANFSIHHQLNQSIDSTPAIAIQDTDGCVRLVCVQFSCFCFHSSQLLLYAVIYHYFCCGAAPWSARRRIPYLIIPELAHSVRCTLTDQQPTPALAVHNTVTKVGAPSAA